MARLRNSSLLLLFLSCVLISGAVSSHPLQSSNPIVLKNEEATPISLNNFTLATFLNTQITTIFLSKMFPEAKNYVNIEIRRRYLWRGGGSTGYISCSNFTEDDGVPIYHYFMRTLQIATTEAHALPSPHDNLQSENITLTGTDGAEMLNCDSHNNSLDNFQVIDEPDVEFLIGYEDSLTPNQYPSWYPSQFHHLLHLYRNLLTSTVLMNH